MRKKPPTINDVAAMAGVSKRTVSRVINKSDKVNQKTREKIQSVIEKLNFVPDRQARGLAASRSYLIGLVYDYPTLFIAGIQRGVLKVCGEAGYELVVHVCPSEEAGALDNIAGFIKRARIDGLIILPPVSEVPGLVSMLEGIGCDYVRFTSQIDDEPSRLVTTDYGPAISDLASHLVDLGHRQMAFITGPVNSISSRLRQEAFVKALKGHGLELKPGMLVQGAFTYESGLEAAEELLSHEHRPTAIFAANDEMAFAVMNVAHKQGIKVPGDLSVVGFDGTRFSDFVIPSLSTVTRQTGEMARLATLKVLAQIESGTNEACQLETLVSPSFLPRGSTGPVSSK